MKLAFTLTLDDFRTVHRHFRRQTRFVGKLLFLLVVLAFASLTAHSIIVDIRAGNEIDTESIFYCVIPFLILLSMFYVLVILIARDEEKQYLDRIRKSEKDLQQELWFESRGVTVVTPNGNTFRSWRDVVRIIETRDWGMLYLQPSEMSSEQIFIPSRVFSTDGEFHHFLESVRVLWQRGVAGTTLAERMAGGQSACSIDFDNTDSAERGPNGSIVVEAMADVDELVAVAIDLMRSHPSKPEYYSCGTILWVLFLVILGYWLSFWVRAAFAICLGLIVISVVLVTYFPHRLLWLHGSKVRRMRKFAAAARKSLHPETFTHPIQWTFGPEGVMKRTLTSQYKYEWANFTEIMDHRLGLVLIAAGGEWSLFVPRRAFRDVDHYCSAISQSHAWRAAAQG